MSLENYFAKLIEKVEESDIQNNGRDRNGFYKPTKVVILRHLQLLKDLHGKPLAKKMLKASWQHISEELPPEWLILKENEKLELQKMLE